MHLGFLVKSGVLSPYRLSIPHSELIMTPHVFNKCTAVEVSFEIKIIFLCFVIAVLLGV